MANQYAWLHSNLDKYQFNTDEAKKLYEEFKGINITDEAQPSEDVMAKLVDCYDRFIKMFNNNPFSYKYGLKEFEIETSEFDYYFVKGNDGLVPVGYYRKKHQVESVLLLSEKIEKQNAKTVDIKAKLIESFEKESQSVNTEYEKFKKAKKASYLRGLIAVIASVLTIWYSISFFNITNLFEIIKSIGDKQEFINTVVSGMANMPIFADSGVAGWVWLMITHITLLIIVFSNIKNIKNEFVLTYKKNITAKFDKTTKSSINRINIQFEEALDKDTQALLSLARQGTSASIERELLSRIIKKVRYNLNIAKEFLKKEFSDIRGIKNNWTVFFFAIVACIGYFSYSLMADPQFKADFEQKSYELQVKMDNAFLRSKKIVQLTAENCPIYSSTSVDSKIKHTLPIWTEVELTEKKMIGEESWSKIKKITDTEVVSGWVPTVCTVPYNKVDYNNFVEVGIESADCSSYLVGQNTEYVPEFAYDWNRQTSWQDGDEYSTGEGEYITLNFAEATTINMIQIFPGNAKREDLYWKNERIKKAKLKFSNGKSVTYEFDDLFNEPFQTIWLNKPVETSFVTIEVVDVYSGEEYTDLCISEIHAYSMNQN